jgi:hypothetical protein
MHHEQAEMCENKDNAFLTLVLGGGRWSAGLRVGKESPFKLDSRLAGPQS